MSVSPVATPSVIPPPAALGNAGRARARFDELISLGKQAVQSERIWAQIGRLAVQMEEDQDFAALGFDSMGACIMEIEILSGYDRSSIYAYKTLAEALAANGVGYDAMIQMRLGSAQIVRQLPTALQKDAGVQLAARAKPKVFRETLASEYPQALIESKIRLSLNLDASLYLRWRAFLNDCRTRNGEDISYESALEELLAIAEQEG